MARDRLDSNRSLGRNGASFNALAVSQMTYLLVDQLDACLQQKKMHFCFCKIMGRGEREHDLFCLAKTALADVSLPPKY